MDQRTARGRPWATRSSDTPIELVLTGGWLAVAAGYILAALAVPTGWDWARVAVLALALAAYAAWANHLLATLCLGVVAWVSSAALVSGTGGDLVAHDAAGLLRLVVLAVAATVGALVGRGLRPSSSR